LARMVYTRWVRCALPCRVAGVADGGVILDICDT